MTPMGERQAGRSLVGGRGWPEVCRRALSPVVTEGDEVPCQINRKLRAEDWAVEVSVRADGNWEGALCCSG